MPKLFADEHGMFSANFTATVTITPDDSQVDCHPGNSTIVRGSYLDHIEKVDLPFDVCGQLREATRFHHAIGVDGQPQASVIQVRVNFWREQIMPAPPPPALSPAIVTSGHFLDYTDQMAEDKWLSFRFPIAVPNWSAGLIGQHNLPKDAKIGVLLDLKVNAGLGVIDTCKVAMPSGDERLDKATCWALSFGSYSELYGGIVRSGAQGYPLIVQWHGDKAAIAPLVEPNVPHMPKDVVLRPADRPGNVDPAQHIVQLDIELDTAGHATGCKVMATSGSDAWDAASCRLTLDRARFTAAQDWFGQPARGLYQVQVDWSAMAIRPRY